MEGGSKFVANSIFNLQEEQKVQSNPLVQRILTISSQGAEFHKLTQTGSTPRETTVELDKDFPVYKTAITGKFAPFKGQFAVIVDSMGLHWVDTQTGKEIRFVDQYAVTAIDFSPRDTYLITSEKYNAGKKNLLVWNTQTGREVAQFEWKKQSKEGPKSIKFSKDERFCARLSSKTSIDFYQDGDFSQPKAIIVANQQTLGKKTDPNDNQKAKSLWFDGVDFIPVCTDKSGQQQLHYMVAWQNSEGLTESNDQSGNVYFFDLNSSIERPKFNVQCSKAQEIYLRPSPTGAAILIWSQNYVDSSGKSYYGEHCLQYIQLVGGKSRVFVPVFDGMIHDVKWSAFGDYFIVISGTQPAVATLYDQDSNPLFEFGKRYRNTIRIDPFSNAAIIGGFGNLAGEIDVWNLEKHIEFGKTKSYCAVGIDWAPNGLYFMTGVLYERVKVDNDVKIFLANGQFLHTIDFNHRELNEIHWQPFEKGILPKPNLNSLGKAQEEVKQQAQPKKWFRPPGGNSVFSQIMRQEMSKTNEKGPKQVDKTAYNDLMNVQAQQHATILANSNQNTQNPSQDPPIAQEAWRKNFGSIVHEPKQTSQPLANEYPIEEQKLSKHAKRRAKKKQKVVVCEGDQHQQLNDY